MDGMHEALATSQDELNCVRCGYMLRGLALTQVCPECATAIAFTVASTDPRRWPPEWFRRLVRGVVLAQLAILIGISFEFLFTALTYRDWIKLPNGQWVQTLERYREALLSSTAMLAIGLFIRAGASIAYSEPISATLLRRPGTRALLKLGCVTTAGLTLALFALSPLSSRAFFDELMLFLWIPWLIACLSCVWQFCICFSELARKLVNRRLARVFLHFRILLIPLGALMLLESCNRWPFVNNLIAARSSRTYWRIIDGAVLAGRTVAVIVGCFALVLLYRLCRDLRNTAIAARGDSTGPAPG